MYSWRNNLECNDAIEAGNPASLPLDNSWVGLETLEPRLLLSTVQSDDFTLNAIDPAIWTLIDPVGDAAITFDGEHAFFSVPQGVDHDIWDNGNNAPRIMQTIEDEDFSIEIKFDNQPAVEHAMHGLLVEQDADHFLRFDFVSHGTSNQLYVFAADISNSLPTEQYSQRITDDLPAIMRVERTGDHWVQTYSYDGINWETAATFDYSLDVTGVGLFVGNAPGVESPAFTSEIDYFHNIDQTTPDIVAPIISSITTTAETSTISVNFATNEPASSIIRYGLTDQYELGVINLTNQTLDHAAVIAGLDPLTVYQIQIEATDAAGNTSIADPLSVRTAAADQTDPIIDVWYGQEQNFGHIGNPQKWVNILGRVIDNSGIDSLTYTLNGGPVTQLSLGPDARRLLMQNDFNVELDINDLIDGANTVTITATDTEGNTSVESVTVNYAADNVWPINYQADWSAAQSINDVAQVVDGLWTLTDDTIRPVEVGYDRIVAIGDIHWDDYEVTVPITLHAWDDAGFLPPSYGPGVGILNRWQGHYDWDGSQPRWGYEPLGAIGWYRWKDSGNRVRLAIEDNDGPIAVDNSGKQLDFDVTYMFKMRVETIAGEDTYSLKVWQQGTEEPQQWDLTANGPTDGLDTGSVLLLAHHADATFGMPVVVPVADTTAPQFISLNTQADGTAISISGLSDELAAWTVEYGLDTSYDLGVITEPTEVINHQLLIQDMDELTTYYLRVTAIDVSGNTTVRDNLVVTTGEVDQTPPVISQINTQIASDAIAVNATTDEAALFTIEYGLTDQFELGAVTGPTAVTDHTLVIENLDPQTIYHLNITAVDINGNPTPPINFTVTTSRQTVITSDHFNSSSLNAAIWDFIDPRGDSSVTVNGSQLEIHVPGNSDHDVWRDGNFAARIMQNSPDVDFELEVKFDSAVQGEFASQGILIEQDDQNFLRFDFYSSALGTSVFAASFTDGEPTIRNRKTVNATDPIFMRVSRSGNTWRQSYSYDGQTWYTATTFDFDLNVQRVGPYAGNAPGADSPEYTAIIDYFINTADPAEDNQPPIILDLQTQASADTISLIAEASELSSWSIQYGLTEAYELGSVDCLTPSLIHNCLIDNLVQQTTYHLLVSAQDIQGNAIEPIALTVDTLAPGQLVSDDFSGDSLNTTVWTFIDPRNDAYLSINHSQLQIAIPGFIDHDIWSLDNNAARIMQSAADTDFQVEVKFDAPVAGEYTMNGLIIEQDATNFLRFDFYSSSTDTNIIAVSFADDVPVIEFDQPILPDVPTIMRLTRTGDDWLQEYSYDGLNWLVAADFTFALHVQNVGVFVANAGDSPPAHTATVDYFVNTQSPLTDITAPIVSNVQAQASPTTLDITADTDESATWTVDYGLTDGYELGSVTSATLAASQHALIENLDPQTTYHLRITATDTSGNTSPPIVLTADTLAQDTTPPTIDHTQLQQGPTALAVTVNTDEPTTVTVRYGLTDAYELGEVSTAELTTAATVNLDNLTPETAYHLQIIATDGQGNASSPTVLIVQTTEAGQVVSDEFDEATVNTALWQFVDPHNDSSVTANGAQLLIAVPAGTSHDLWTDGISAARVMQSATDTDFRVEAKFDAVVAGEYAMNGLLVQQNSDTFIRFEFYSDAGNVHVMAACFETGSDPVFAFDAVITHEPSMRLRITREGDSWKQEYSADGQTWQTAGEFTFALNVTQVGLYAGNAGENPPAHTATIDYFKRYENTGENPTAPVITNAQTTVTDTTIEFTADTDVPSTLLIRYGLDANYDLGEVTLDTLSQSHLALIENLDPETTYYLQITAADELGTPSEPLAITATTDAPATPAPVITSTLTHAGIDQLLIDADTDVPTTLTIQYGLTDAYELGTLTLDTLATRHQATIGQLAADTPYYLQIIAATADATPSAATTTVVTTLPTGQVYSDDFDSAVLNTALWTVVNPLADGSASTDGSQLLLSVPADVEHNIYANRDALRLVQDAPDEDFEIEFKLNGKPTGEHTLSGIIIEQDDQNFVRFDFVSHGDSDDLWIFHARFFEPADARPTMLRKHTKIADGETLYMKVTRSSDQWTQSYSYDGQNWTEAATFTYAIDVTRVGLFAGNAFKETSPAHTAAFEYFHYTPITPPDTTAPAITNAQTVVTTTTIEFTADTDEPATLLIKYGLDQNYDLGEISLDTLAQNHQALIDSLDPDTTYYLQITATDEYGNTSDPLEITATTEAPDTTAPVIANTQTTVTTTTIEFTANTDEPATLLIKYGLDQNYDLGEISLDTLAQNHQALIDSLDPDTTYYLQITATDEHGNTSDPVEITATTEAPAQLVSDEFNTTILDTDTWQVFDPQQDATVTVNGSQLVVNVPGGVDHDLWLENNAVRIMQQTENTDFTVEIKFDTLVTGEYASNGLLFEQNDGNFLRFDFFSTAKKTNVFVARFEDGTPTVLYNQPTTLLEPTYMRVTRTGDDWLQEYSNDGVTWITAASFTYALNVSAAGLFVGNAAGETSPEFTARIDYYHVS